MSIEKQNMNSNSTAVLVMKSGHVKVETLLSKCIFS